MGQGAVAADQARWPAADSGYGLVVGSSVVGRAASSWILLGVASLIAAGLFSILLVLARTPGIQESIPFVDFFHVALVVHVNLSVLVWLLSVAGTLWSLTARRSFPLWDRLSMAMAALGTLLMVICPFLGAGDPLMNNYVPILRDPLFYAGLGLFTAGISSHLIHTLLSQPLPGAHLDGRQALQVGITLSAMVTGLAIVAFVASFAGVDPGMSGEVYFEFLFWGGGHVLQFAYVLLMLVAWIVLAHASGARFVLTPRLTVVFLLIAALPMVTVPFLYLAHDVASPGHRLAFTELMKYGGLSCLPLGLAVLASLWRAKTPQGEGKHLRAALESSLLLFAVGGMLGFLVAGLDIVIPAHYHGSIVGVTLAFMGLIYYLLPRLGYGTPAPRMALWQPYLYGAGQLLHIAGLAWTGGYGGVQRKTAGVAQGLDRMGEIAGMALMGLGGLISVIGGVLFLVVVIGAIRRRKRTEGVA